MILFIISGIAAIITLITIRSKRTKKIKRERLLMKYQSTDIVDRIMRQLIWQDMSRHKLIDSWGNQVEIGTKVVKTKTKETFKYNKIGANRFGSRVILENGIVVGWEKK